MARAAEPGARPRKPPPPSSPPPSKKKIAMTPALPHAVRGLRILCALPAARAELRDGSGAAAAAAARQRSPSRGAAEAAGAGAGAGAEARLFVSLRPAAAFCAARCAVSAEAAVVGPGAAAVTGPRQVPGGGLVAEAAHPLGPRQRADQAL